MGQPSYHTFRSESGLIVARAGLAELGTESLRGEMADYRDQLFAYVTEAELELPETPADAVVELAQGLPFWPAIQRLCAWQRQLWHARQDVTKQVELAFEIYGSGPFFGTARRFVARNPNTVVFSEQQFFTVERLLIQHAENGPLTAGWDLPEAAQLARLIQAVPGTILGSQLERDAGQAPQLEDEHWLRFFIGHGGLATRRRFANELARAARLYGELASDEASRADHQFVDLESWLIEEFGLGFAELFAAGQAVYAGSKAYVAGEPPVLLDVDYFANTEFSDRAPRALAALSAEREWYRTRFAEMAGNERREAFEIIPFLTRPALRQPDGKILPFSPRALEAWTGASGFYYRLFEIARAKGDDQRQRFNGFHGRLTERYLVEFSRSALPTIDSPVFVPGRVHGDYPYETRDGEKRTPDVLIDMGPDLICIEITSGQLTLESLVEATAEAVRRDLERLVAKKVRQLDRAIIDLIARPGLVPGLEMGQVRRIWPIVVSRDGLIQTDAFWQAVEAATTGCLQTTEPLTLLDIEEHEQLMEIASADSSLLLAVLQAKTAPTWRRREFAAYWAGEGRAALGDHHGPLSAAYEQAVATAVAAAFGDQALAEHERRLAEARGTS